ncbi:hypothetical protein D3C80_665280 [compost metagenome]
MGVSQNSSPISSQAVSTTIALGSISLILPSPPQSLPGATSQPAAAAVLWPLCPPALIAPSETPAPPLAAIQTAVWLVPKLENLLLIIWSLSQTSIILLLSISTDQLEPNQWGCMETNVIWEL